MRNGAELNLIGVTDTWDSLPQGYAKNVSIQNLSGNDVLCRYAADTGENKINKIKDGASIILPVTVDANEIQLFCDSSVADCINLAYLA